MATTVENPFNTQQAAATNTGIVDGAMRRKRGQPQTPLEAAPLAEGKATKVNRFSREDRIAPAVQLETAVQPASVTATAKKVRTQRADLPPKENKSSSAAGATAQGATAQGAASNVSTYAPVTRQVNEATDTVQGQVNSILSKDSPLMQRARTLATQQMAQRGLVNSSMAQGAGVAAMVDRATPIAVQDASIYNQTASENMLAKNVASQFNAGESNKFGLQAAEQKFVAAQNKLEQAFRASESDKSIAAQKSLQSAQLQFQQAQNELDRAQQTTIANKTITANQEAQSSQQTFQAAQSQLDREQQEAMTVLANNLNQANVSKTFAANLTLQTSNAVNAISLDANLTPEAKKVAIQNVIDGANSTMQWGSTFYNTTLPTIAAPGTTAGTVDSGGTYKPPAQAPATMAIGQTSDPVWEAILKENLDAHIARYGKGWDTDSTTPDERNAQLILMQTEYKRRTGV